MPSSGCKRVQPVCCGGSQGGPNHRSSDRDASRTGRECDALEEPYRLSGARDPTLSLQMPGSPPYCGGIRKLIKSRRAAVCDLQEALDSYRIGADLTFVQVFAQSSREFLGSSSQSLTGPRAVCRHGITSGPSPASRSFSASFFLARNSSSRMLPGLRSMIRAISLWLKRSTCPSHNSSRSRGFIPLKIR